MSKHDNPLDTLLHALNHPTRRRILRSLAREPGSASSLSKEHRIDLSTVSYHLNRVLAKECDLVELVDQIPRRGSLEKVYGLKGDIWDGAFASAEDRKGGSALDPLSAARRLIEAVEAMDGGGSAGHSKRRRR